MENEKTKAIKNLESLSENLFELFVDYYLDYYKYAKEEFAFYYGEDRNFKDGIFDFIIKVKQQVMLTEDEYKNALFGEFNANFDDFRSKIIDYLSKMQFLKTIPIFLNKDNYTKLFMMFYKNSAINYSKILADSNEINVEELEDTIQFLEDFFDCNDPESEDDTPLDDEINFDSEVVSLIQSYVHTEDSLNEFSKNSFNDYYKKYCLAGNENKMSEKENILYDFNSKDKYRNYGDKISNLIKADNNFIYDFFDISKTIEKFSQLFAGNCSIKFSGANQNFQNVDGRITIGLHLTSPLIKNYGCKKTFDMVIFKFQKPISIYPIDYEDFAHKFKQICDKYDKTSSTTKGLLDLHFQGPFWIIADSVEDIKRGNYKIECLRFPCDSMGDWIEKTYYDTLCLKFNMKIDSHSYKKIVRLSHKTVWDNFVKDRCKKENLPYNYYPRGRVGINNGNAYVNLYFDDEKVRKAIVKKCELDGLNIIFKPETYEKGTHCDYLLD